MAEPDADRGTRSALHQFVLVVVLVGMASALALAWLFGTGQLPVAAWLAEETWVMPALVILALTVVSQLTYVRVPHGEVFEDLAFFEVAAAAGLLLLPPDILLAALLLGLLIAELALRRPALKLAYNVGSFGASTSALICAYWLFDARADPFALQSVIAMLLGMLLFAAVNLSLLAELLLISAGTARLATWRSEWRLSVFMAVGGVGIGMTAVALAREAPALVVFSALPAIALWFGYRSVADHALERERNGWLIRLGGVLADQVTGDEARDEALVAIQRIVRAPSMRLLPAGAGIGGVGTGHGHVQPLPQRVPSEELPTGWTSAVATPVDLGDAEPACLLLGSREVDAALDGRRRRGGWVLPAVDAPVLGALVAAAGTAARAGTSFLALEEESAKLTALVDHASDGIAMIDGSDQVLVWSRTMARMTGVPARTAIGSTRRAAGDPGQGDAALDRILDAASPARDRAEPVTTREHLIRADGVELFVTVTAVRVLAAGTDDGASHVRVVTVHDETRERRLERLKSDFIATVSHELRTPLTPIKGYAQLLANRGGELPEERRQQALNVIADRSDHLARLVDDLLLASEVSEGSELPVEIRAVEVGGIVDQVVASFPSLSGRLTVDMAQPELVVLADPQRAVQCLSNLLTNVEKYTPAGSPVEMHVRPAAHSVAIHVRDNGPGIPEPEAERIFERFYRGEVPMANRTGGAGLGLHIARELAAAMGGALWLTQPAGSGADFILSLRLATSEHSAPSGAMMATAGAQPKVSE